jgi:hypothetical protein
LNTRNLLFIGFIILLIFSAFLGFLFYTREKYKAVNEKWDQEFGSFEAFEKRFPKRSANRSAIELEKLSANLGIDLAPKGVRNRIRPESKTKELFKKLDEEIQKTLRNRLENKVAEVSPTEATKTFLTINEASINEIILFVNKNEFPEWEIDLSKRSQSPIPYLRGQMQLQRLINLEASLLIDESRFSEAEDAINASWRLNKHLMERPELLSYLIGLVVSKYEAGNLRRLPYVHDWHDRLTDSKISEHLWTVLQGEVWVILRMAEEGTLLQQDGKPKGLFEKVFSPFVRVMALDFAEVALRYFLDLKKSDPCSPKRSLKEGEIRKMFPSWNRLGLIMLSDYSGAWNRSKLVSLEADFTERIIEIRKQLHKDPDVFGEAFTFDSRVCKGQTLNYEKILDGFKLSFSKKIDWSIAGLSESTIILPDEYTSASPDRSR